MNDFKSECKTLRDEMLQASKRVLESGWFVLGEEVRKFEALWAKTCGVDHVVGVANGMDALEIALRSLNIGQGDEVITTSMTAFATVLAIYRAGATPVLADIEQGTGLMSIESAQRCITKRTKAVILVHLYGQILNVTKWTHFCENNDLFFIEDCAQAHLAKTKESVAGSFGHASAFSFYPTKNLGALGDAGALATNDENIALYAQKLRNYGQSVRYEHPLIGLNSRLDEIHAAMLSVRLKYLFKNTKRRQEIANKYLMEINNPLIKLLRTPIDKESHVYHLFVIKCLQRDELAHYLRTNGVQTNIHYPIPIHRQKSCMDIICDPCGLKNAEKYSSECLSIPCHPQLSVSQVMKIIELLNKYT